MRLIVEEIENVEVLTETVNGKKSFWIQGPFLQGDIKNRNGRIYESRILAKEVGRYNENYVNKGRAVGELGHPDGPTVNLDRVSHKITELKQNGSNFIGKAKILETPMGRIASALLNDGVTLGVSSRGMGSLVERDGTKFVGEDFMLATAADIVADPSAPDAFVQGIMESKEWIWDNGLLKEVEVSRSRDRINEAARAGRLDEQTLIEFERLLFS
ncbi:prohead core scaffolding protein and protease [Synechococcus phage S-CRM01]|uniref:head maturation protease n=1 Tax=Synechococcus phage S-CRM01 TaxID=1026955 RepID=UPI000209E353|nr:head maturation protease [Synechococcus phage S-CRM01]AEC52988.1 prohead core scaffolding protein and protease [Synechococcus phage S-CRM01]